MAEKNSEHDLELLLEYLKRNRGFDFTGYKRASLARRIERRMQVVGVAQYPDYTDYLEVHPEEFYELFNTILINVTGFFRDASAWEVLTERALPDLIARRAPGSPIRVWSAGCASGEEAYTLAMILAELLGPDEFKTRVKIYATDLDEEALAKARAAWYSADDVEGVHPDLLSRYFDPQDVGYLFKKAFRSQVIFGRHDLIQDAPISRVDVLACRNTLMYFNTETQASILSRFHFALNDHGILFLGRAETLLTHAATFSPVDLKRRISVKTPRRRPDLRERLLLTAENGNNDAGSATTPLLREAAVEAVPVAQIVIDRAGIVAVANERARTLFGLAAEDIGRPLQDLKLSYKPVELRSLIERVSSDRRMLNVREIEWLTTSAEKRWLDLHLTPLIEDGNNLIGVSASFTDITLAKKLQLDLESANRELETAYEELQATNEEMETTNEELQSTVEELETTNEELQSTNEELETMNEELQSTNEELTTINEELSQRSEELNHANSFLEGILMSLRGAVIVVDTDLQVLAWNARAEDLWGLRDDEVVGHHLLGLDIGLPVEKLKQPVRACLTEEPEHVELEVDAINRRGRGIRCRVTCTRLIGPTRQPRGVILMMEELNGTRPKAPASRDGAGKGASNRDRT